MLQVIQTGERSTKLCVAPQSPRTQFQGDPVLPCPNPAVLSVFTFFSKHHLFPSALAYRCAALLSPSLPTSFPPTWLSTLHQVKLRSPQETSTPFDLLHGEKQHFSALQLCWPWEEARRSSSCLPLPVVSHVYQHFYPKRDTVCCFYFFALNRLKT